MGTKDTNESISSTKGRKRRWVVLGDHVRTGEPLAVIFSSELAEVETQYLAWLAELDTEHKKLLRTQNLVRLGAASRQEEEEVTAARRRPARPMVTGLT